MIFFCWVVKLDGVLMPPDGPEEWPEKDSNSQWLVFYRLDGFTFAGKGTVEGNGQKWWDLPCKPHRVLIFKPSYNFRHLQLF